MHPLAQAYMALGLALGSFHDGRSREQAFLSLLLQHLATPNHIPIIDFATVDYWYGMFERGLICTPFPAPPPQQAPVFVPVQVPMQMHFQMQMNPPPLVQLPAPGVMLPNQVPFAAAHGGLPLADVRAENPRPAYEFGQQYLHILENIIRDLRPRAQ